LYEVVYAHPLNNGQYSTIFLQSWLAQRKGHKVNWIKYAYDYTHLQVKKAMHPTLAFANIANPQVFRFTNSLLNSTSNGYNVINED
jgi:fido (protein-threonine AMPylation protein)